MSREYQKHRVAETLMAIDSERADVQRATTRDLLRKLRTEGYVP